MTTPQIILLIILVIVLIGIGIIIGLYYRGTGLLQLEDELWPECDCRGWVKKQYSDLENECKNHFAESDEAMIACECRKAQIEGGEIETLDERCCRHRYAVADEIMKSGTSCLIT